MTLLMLLKLEKNCLLLIVCIGTKADVGRRDILALARGMFGHTSTHFESCIVNYLLVNNEMQPSSRNSNRKNK